MSLTVTETHKSSKGALWMIWLTYLVSVLAVSVLPVPANLRLAHALELLTLPWVLHLAHLAAYKVAAHFRVGGGVQSVVARAFSLGVELLTCEGAPCALKKVEVPV